MNQLAELESRIAALESNAGGEVLRSNNAFIGPAGAVEEPPTGLTKAEVEALLLALFKLAGRAGGQEAIGGTGVADKLILRGTSGSATDIVEWHYLLLGVKLQAERLTLVGEKAIAGLANLTLSGGVFGLTEEFLRLGSNLTKLRQLKISGTNNDYEGFETAPQDCTYAVIPEGGAAILTGAKAFGKHRVILLVNISETETLTIGHESVESEAGNAFHFASEKAVKLKPGETIMLWYVEGNAAGAKERWRDVGGASKNLE